MYIYVYMYMYICICMCTYVYIYIFKIYVFAFMSLYIKINTVYISSISHDPFPSPWSLALAQTSQTALGTLDRRFIRTKITTQNKWYVIYI